MITGKYTLLYSKLAAKNDAPNRARTNNGREVEYTCMHDESEFGDWKKTYQWPDTRVVGYMNDTSQITYVSPSHDKFYFFEKYEYKNL